MILSGTMVIPCPDMSTILIPSSVSSGDFTVVFFFFLSPLPFRSADLRSSPWAPFLEGDGDFFLPEEERDFGLRLRFLLLVEVLLDFAELGLSIS